MIRVTKIEKITDEYIICRLSNQALKRIDLSSLISNHSHLKGIEKMMDPEYLLKAEIGIFGEIFWPQTITNSQGDTWNYDISPEYILHFGEDVDAENETRLTV